MHFTWDEQKRRQNITKHDIDFVDVPDVFEGTMLTVEDDRFAYEEQRWVSVGVMRNRVIVVVYTQTGETVRLISARKATKYEERNYWEQI